jgi:sterol desaturase/sphingolipid hydroxylase (fatty acid hydroxylase superfamily)
VLDSLVRSEAAVYLGLYLAVLAGLAAWEAAAACRPLEAPLRRRWLGNGFLGLLNAIGVRALFPLLGVGWAIVVAERGLGLLPRLGVSTWLAVPVAIAALDGARYGTHRLLHRNPWLWRIHRLHHTDPDQDFTTSLRFHPLEALLDAGVELAVVAALGAPPAAVVLYELAVAVSTPLTHANLSLPARWERHLRRVLVTPDLHRVHHSALPAEMNRNFGSVFSFWDRGLGTYVAEPVLGTRGMSVGLDDFCAPRHLSPLWMLANPLLAPDPPARHEAAATPATGPGRTRALPLGPS